MSEVVIYTKTGCPYCQKAMDQYCKEGIAFREINVSNDREALLYIRQNYGATKVPVIVKDDQLFQIGFEGGG